MNPPARCKIGAFSVRILFLPGLREGGAYGRSEKDSQEIYLSSDLPGPVLADTFIHELLHLLWSYYGLGSDPEAKDEDQVITENELANRLAFALTTFWSDNPDVLKWWTGLLTREDDK